MTTPPSSPFPTTTAAISQPFHPSAPLRRGKWTVEEEDYVARVIRDFSNGTLAVERGTTLRSFLSAKLHCDPMRITKKFTGDACIGKRVFQPIPEGRMPPQALQAIQSSLAALEERWRHKMELQLRDTERKSHRHVILPPQVPQALVLQPTLTVEMAKTMSWLERAEDALKVREDNLRNLAQTQGLLNEGSCILESKGGEGGKVIPYEFGGPGRKRARMVTLETPDDDAGVAALLTFNKKPTKISKVTSSSNLPSVSSFPGPNRIEPLPSTQNAAFDDPIFQPSTNTKPEGRTGLMTTIVSADSLYQKAPNQPLPPWPAFETTEEEEEEGGDPWASSITPFKVGGSGMTFDKVKTEGKMGAGRRGRM